MERGGDGGQGRHGSSKFIRAHGEWIPGYRLSSTGTEGCDVVDLTANLYAQDRVNVVVVVVVVIITVFAVLDNVTTCSIRFNVDHS